MVDEASSVVCGKSDVEAPRVIRIIDKLFYILLEIERPKWIKEKQVLLAERHRNHPPKNEAERKKQIENSYSVLLPLVEEYSVRMGVHPTSVRVTRAEKRFGSCSPKNALCFSPPLPLRQKMFQTVSL